MASLATNTISDGVVLAEPSATSGGVCLVGSNPGVSEDACLVSDAWLTRVLMLSRMSQITSSLSQVGPLWQAVMLAVVLIVLVVPPPHPGMLDKLWYSPQLLPLPFQTPCVQMIPALL